MWRAARSWMRRRWSRRCKTSALPARRSTCSARDRKSTRLNSSHSQISYAVFCLKKKKGKGSTQDNASLNPKVPVLCNPSAQCTHDLLADIGPAPKLHRNAVLDRVDVHLVVCNP